MSNNKPAIPAWQRTHQPNTTTTTPAEQTSPTSDPQQPEHSPAPTPEEPTQEASTQEEQNESEPKTPSLLEQAQRFLDDPTIQDAPREKKVAFLQSKGVNAEEIEQLLGAAVEEHALSGVSEAGERAWSTTPPKPTQSRMPPPPPPQPREIPPIVTYPEFLAQTEKPPPLMTTQRLFTTVYAAGGLFATMYGFSKYILAPMSTELADDRHDFATHTQEQLTELNKRLRDAASEDPALKVKASVADIMDNISEAESDPTELYHRDFGTQTTPSLSRRPSVSETADAEPMVTAHENRLKIISSHLKELEATRSNDTASSNSLKTKLSDLSSYLTEMSYQNNYYSGMGFYGSNYGLPKTKDGKDDQIEVLKSDIRAVKGVFLSARNFPAGGRSNTPPIGRVA